MPHEAQDIEQREERPTFELVRVAVITISARLDKLIRKGGIANCMCLIYPKTIDETIPYHFLTVDIIKVEL